MNVRAAGRCFVRQNTTRPGSVTLLPGSDGSDALNRTREPRTRVLGDMSCPTCPTYVEQGVVRVEPVLEHCPTTPYFVCMVGHIL